MFNRTSCAMMRRNLACTSSIFLPCNNFIAFNNKVTTTTTTTFFAQNNNNTSSSSSSSASFAVLSTSKRWCSTSSSSKNENDIEGGGEKVTDQDGLNLGNDMPPLLQYNENLVNAALRLVEFANQSSEENVDGVPVVTPEVEAGIANIMAMLFHEEYIPLVEQFLAVRELTKLEAIRKNPKLLEAVHDITAALVPEPVVGLLKVVDADLEIYDNDALGDVEHFIVLILEGQENDDEFVRALQTMQNRNPQLDQSTSFIILLQNMNDVLLQARLAHLLTEACLSFDPEKTGKIKVAELEDSLKKILPKEAVEKMMGRIEGDENGCVPYAQMSRVLLRGKEVEVVGVKE